MKRKYLISTLGVMLVVATLMASLASAQDPTFDPQAGPDYGPPIVAPGYYLVGSKNLDPALFHQGGDMQFFSWTQLQPNPGPNGFYWATLDQFVQEHSAVNGHAKGVGISITVYDGREGDGIAMMPGWAQNANTTFLGYDGNLFEKTNFSFEQDLASWSSSGAVSISTTTAHAGTKSAKLGGAPNATAELLRGGVRIPTGLTAEGINELTYWWRSDGTDAGDTLKVELLEGSTVLGVVQTVGGGSSTWQKVTFDLKPYQAKWASLRFTVTTNGASPDAAFYIDEVSVRTQPLIPKYWSAEYQSLYKAFVQALGDRYRDNPNVAFISIGTGQYGETRATGTFDRPATKAAGLPDSNAWVATVNAITDMYVDAFSQGGRLRKVLLLQNAPFQYSAQEREDFSDYAAIRKVGLSFNGMYWDWNYAETVNYPFAQVGTNQYGTAAFDPALRYGDQVAVGFETYSYMLGDPNNNIRNEENFFYWATLSVLDLGTDYVRMSSYSGWYLGPNDQPVPAYTDIMGWAAPYFGASFNPRDNRPPPSVWVAMRDHIFPACYWLNQASCESTTSWPPLGNFEFYLYQYDQIAGGQTRPETSLDSWGGQVPDMGLCPVGSPGPAGYPCYPDAHNPSLPNNAREALMIRRTDQASNNSFMFFDIDDMYMAGGVNTAEITVTYWDHGTDKFRLQYDSTSGPKYARPTDSANLWVEKQGTNTFRKVTFRVTDAKFANGLTGGTDFVLDSRDANGAKDGDEWIHFVDVRKIDSSQPTSTPTPTNTPSPTPTNTPTATRVPTVGGITGVAFVDANGNGLSDPAETRLPNLMVSLKNGAGQVVATVLTSAGGEYSFQDLAPGTYTVESALPESHFPRPAQHQVDLVAGALVEVPLPYYSYNYVYLPMTLKGTTSP